MTWKDYSSQVKKPAIRVRFYCNHDDCYAPIFVKPIKMTELDIAKFGGLDEVCRLNLTLFKFIGCKDQYKKYLSNAIDKTVALYYNGSECAWKFFDGDADKSIYFIKGKIPQKIYDCMDSDTTIVYEPHNDHNDNYGDESIHAVYDLKVNN